jgi:mannose-6-phosphate isomerase-like protein (cupin superfamily)
VKGLGKMHYNPYIYPYQYLYYVNVPIPMYNYGRQSVYWTFPNEIEHANKFDSFRSSNGDRRISLTDYGPKPFVVNINEATKQNNTYRTALWTGTHLQVTLMSLNVGEDIGLEMHSNVDQFLRIEQGQGIVQMGKSKDNLNFKRNVYDDYAIMIPAGTWHNLTNTCNIPIKLYSIYAPPNHPFGTVHVTKADAMVNE